MLICHSSTHSLLIVPICFALNQNLEESDFIFHPSAFKRNESKRSFYKLAANSLFGKIAQRSDYKKLVYVSSQEELEQLFFSANEIQEISCLNDQVCQVLLKPLIKNCTPNRNTNCTIGSQITAFARQEIYEHILRLESIPSAVLYYVDVAYMLIYTTAIFRVVGGWTLLREVEL